MNNKKEKTTADNISILFTLFKKEEKNFERLFIVSYTRRMLNVKCCKSSFII